MVRGGDPEAPRAAKVVTGLETRTLGEYEQCDGMMVDKDTLQGVFDQMWLLGFRPADGTGNAGHVGSLKDHISSLQGIVDSMLPLAEKKLP